MLMGKHREPVDARHIAVKPELGGKCNGEEHAYHDGRDEQSEVEVHVQETRKRLANGGAENLIIQE
nr:hypothetical protein [Rubrobacter indicoceani]